MSLWSFLAGFAVGGLSAALLVLVGIIGLVVRKATREMSAVKRAGVEALRSVQGNRPAGPPAA